MLAKCSNISQSSTPLLIFNDTYD